VETGAPKAAFSWHRDCVQRKGEDAPVSAERRGTGGGGEDSCKHMLLLEKKKDKKSSSFPLLQI